MSSTLPMHQRNGRMPPPKSALQRRDTAPPPMLPLHAVQPDIYNPTVPVAVMCGTDGNRVW